MLDQYVRNTLGAQIYDLVIETPIDYAASLSARFNNELFLKREDLQPVFSFKLRGAYHKLKQLTESQRRCGVVAASAGNHAQGLAMAASHLGLSATIVMPVTTPSIKVEGVRSRGGEVVLYGDSFDEAAAHARLLEAERGLVFVHPFDDPDVIAGQGTIGQEILKQMADPIDAIFLPVGGGGLAAGVAAWVKFVRPEIKIIAVEPEDAACLHAALEVGHPTRLKKVGLFADGVAVAEIGHNTFDVLKQTVDEVVLCNTDEICAAIKDIFDNTRSIAEPAGALAIAGMKKYIQQHKVQGQRFVAVESGANTNFDRLRYISERTEIGEQREAVFAVTIPEQPGSFKRFCQILGRRSITEFNYRYNCANSAHIFVGVQVVEGGRDRAELLHRLQDAGYEVHDLTDNEVAKLHTRHMVGGGCDLDGERIYRTKFPERPGALLEFLSSLGEDINISLFHYRNHGAAYGRVLIGLTSNCLRESDLEQMIEQTTYEFVEETSNSACRLFLNSVSNTDKIY